MNDLFEDDIKNVEPQEELKRIISKVGNEKSLITMCFSILSTKCLLKNLSNDEDGKSISIKKDEKKKVQIKKWPKFEKIIINAKKGMKIKSIYYRLK